MPIAHAEEFHLVKPQDRRRIGCHHMDGCNRWAYASIYLRFNVGRHRGISFYYICRAHFTQRAKAQEIK